MKRTILLRVASALVAAAALAGTVAGPAGAATAPAATAPGPKIVAVTVPLTGTIASGAGSLTIKGNVALVIQPVDPVLPQDPIRPVRVLTAVVVRAANAAVSCQAVGAQLFSLTATTAPFVGHYAFQPLDPVRPRDGGACRALGQLSIDYKLTVNANGTITGATAVALDSE
ncbi:hypothetical protein ACQCSX_16180 [Pseudarthrobacter sp. P1]|uniref:hypothetical protein n=1 Tax=Pseudarthrobacter sp. P1 TaxID=3418418 RepID=UPI003CED9F88